MRLDRVLLALCIGFVGAALPAAGAELLGASGRLISVAVVRVPSTDPAASVDSTALRFTVAQDGSTTSVIVPGTEGDDVESSPFVWEGGAEHTVFVLWLSRSAIHHVIHLRTWRDGAWGEDIAVCSDEYSDKSHLVAIGTRDSLPRFGSTADRQVVHLLWREDSGTGSRLQHMPLLFTDGVFRGAGPIRALAELTAAFGGQAIAADPGERDVLIAQRGRDADELGVLFSGAEGDAVASLVVAATPSEIERLANLVSTHVEGSALGLDDAGRIADDVDAFLTSQPTTVRPSALRGIVDVMRSHINPGGRTRYTSRRALAALAADAVRVGAAELLAPAGRRAAPLAILDAAVGDAGETLHLVVSAVARWSAPADPGSDLVLAHDAAKVMATWHAADGRRMVRESNVDGSWGPALHLDVDPALDPQALRALLQARADDTP